MRVFVAMWSNIRIEFDAAAGEGSDASGGVGLHRHIFQFNSNSRAM